MALCWQFLCAILHFEESTSLINRFGSPCLVPQFCRRYYRDVLYLANQPGSRVKITGDKARPPCQVCLQANITWRYNRRQVSEIIDDVISWVIWRMVRFLRSTAPIIASPRFPFSSITWLNIVLWWNSGFRTTALWLVRLASSHIAASMSAFKQSITHSLAKINACSLFYWILYSWLAWSETA